MKILHLSTFDTIGGAARAAYRVHRGLREIGSDSWMLVQKSVSGDRTVLAPKTVLGQVAGRLRAEVDGLALRPYPRVNKAVFDIQRAPNPLQHRIQQINPDIINLHWILNSYLPIEALPRFQKPIVWTLMDMWLFTGGCHYTQECEHFQQSCGTCPQLGSSKFNDLSYRTWQRKVKAWSNLNLTIVAPTRWLADCARASSLCKDLRIEVIPFCLDIRVYKPIDWQVARAALNLPLDKKLILFGAISATQDRRKGFHLLQPALQQLAQTELHQQAEVVVFGSSKPESPVDLGFPAHYLGHLNDHVSLALAYSAADVFVAPSLQEAFGQTASEAMSCGTPVVAFKGTGLADIVDHQHNGYLANPFEIEDLAQGIRWILGHTDSEKSLRLAARQKAEQAFALELQARRYLDLYQDLLAQTSPA
ncbi:glycosyltransferase family 4 protein [Thermoleptolyngbya sp. M55_K2018_002]|uniref:glycosyltransferase family 4 protein n=1 Tax=Thermoleptolyngbya sp. M55_K2018_002 TaxID=2747808 RepID=UPI001A0639A6|nr:glycosyltransferase family 4 protein [Thermoleptolyngbya sp. M55_K2018_002]HIK39451.1 glycosyltransferase family 4 protein [Thermoleptolyngbya sp. M55_K2018_002]